MASFIGRLFGTEKAISDITDKDNGLLAQAGSWVGGLKYTDEEKAENAIEVRKWGLQQLDALAPFKIVQRILAFAISFVWVLVAMNVLVAIWISPEVKKDMLEFAFSDFIFWPVTVCYGLYFGGGFVESLKNKLGK